MPGSTTCGQLYDGYQADGIGSLGFEALDAQTFAEWRIDFLKYDWCRADVNDGLDTTHAFVRMRREIDATGRPILYAISEAGRDASLGMGARRCAHVAHDRRHIPGDVRRHPDQPRPADRPAPLLPAGSLERSRHAPGRQWCADGRENRAHFFLWALLNAPLIAGNDVRTMTPQVRDLLCHRDIIAVDQDWAGRQGRLVSTEGAAQVWAKPMSDGGVTTVMLNRGDEPLSIRADSIELGIGDANTTIRDL